MKGGKAGRKRRTSGAGAPPRGDGRGKPAKATPKRAAGGAPRKGSRKKSFGAMPTAHDD